MKRFLVVLIALVVVGLPTWASAQDAEAADGGEVETRFYDFNEMLIDGEFMRPEGMFTRARDSARFERLLDLRREFMDEIEESAKEEALD